MVLLLAILAYIVYITMNSNESFSNNNLKNNDKTTSSVMENQNPTIESKNNIVLNRELSEVVNPLKNQKRYVVPTGLAPEKEEKLNAGIKSYNEDNEKAVKNHENIRAAVDKVLNVKVHEAAKPYRPVGSMVVNTDKNDKIVIDSSKLYSPDPRDIPLLDVSIDREADYDQTLIYNPNTAKNMKNVHGVLDGNYFTIANNIERGVKVFKENAGSEFTYASIKEMKGIPSDKDFDPASLLIDSSNFLCAPLCDNLYYTNSIANTNKNASQDLRGDVCIKFNNNFTPFYQSTIYGEPLTINRLGDCPNKAPECLI